MMKKYGTRSEIRTDLALEARESFPGDGGEIHGVEVREWSASGADITITEVVVMNKQGEDAMGKPIGTYLTLETPGLAEKDEDFHQEVVRELAKQIRKLMELHHLKSGSCETESAELSNTRRKMKQEQCVPSVLVVGLGNMAAAPDSLGPRVLENLQVTRHLSLEYGKAFCERNGYPVLSGLAPGVMAQTGMETAEIVSGVVNETKPDLLIVVDALAARSAKRLGTTIQLSDTGIHPGSGVGNHRRGMTEEIFHIPVLAIGVPTVIGAAAVIQDTIGAMVKALNQDKATERYGTYVESLDAEEQYALIREVLEPEFGPMYVTPHDIDERVKQLSYTISEAIHEALFR